MITVGVSGGENVVSGVSVEHFKGLRKDWTTARDREKKPPVKPGAVKGVSMGDSIDNVYKAGQQNYSALVAALNKLMDDATKYNRGLQDKNPALVVWLSNNIDKPAQGLLKAAESDTKLLLNLTQAFNRVPLQGKFPDLTDAYGAPGSGEKPLDQLAPDLFKQQYAAAKYYTELSQQLQKTIGKLQVDLAKYATKRRLNHLGDKLKLVAEGSVEVLRAGKQPGWYTIVRYHRELPNDAYTCHEDIGRVAKAALRPV